MSTHQGVAVVVIRELTELVTNFWFTLTSGLREALLPVINPLPYIIVLLFVLSLGGEWLGAGDILFTLSLIMTFLYLLVRGAVEWVQVELAEQKENLPEAKDRYVKGPWLTRFSNIVYDVIFDFERESDPSAEHTNNPISHLVGTAVLSLTGTIFGFYLFGFVLAFLLNNGDIAALREFVDQFGPVLHQTLPVTLADLLYGVLPFLSDLTFKVQIFVVGIIFVTGFVFRNGARCLVEAADELHRQALRFMNERYPVSFDEAIPLAALLGFYILLIKAI